jgi:AcrR family transcriptional regulator
MPFRGKTKHDVVLEFRHAEILSAAQKIFALKGFDEASVEEIAQAAGVAKGTVYLYYPSKRDLYREALKCGLVSMCEDLESQVRAATSTEAKIRIFMAAKLHYFEQNRDFFKIYYSEFGKAVLQQPWLQEGFEQFHFRQLRLLAEALQEGVQNRTLRNLPVDETAFAILNLTRGIITQRLLGWTKTRLEDDIEFMFDLTWKGLAGK